MNRLNISVPMRLVFITALQNALFVVPVVITYYGEKGVNLGAFLLMQALFKVSVLVLEVPTGYLADRWDRHTQLKVSAVLALVAHTMLIFAQGFGGVFLVELTLALACAFASGTREAYLYEALRQRGNMKRMVEWQSALMLASMLAEMVCGLVAGWLFVQWLHWPAVAESVAALLALTLAWSLPNVPRTKRDAVHANPWIDLWNVLHMNLRKHPKVPWLVLGPFTLFGQTLVLFWVFLSKMNDLLDPVWISWAVASMFAVKALLVWKSGWLVRTLGERNMVRLLPVLLLVGTVAMVFSQQVWLVWLGAVVGGSSVHALGKPMVISLISHNVVDGERATILSTGSMVNACYSAVLLFAAPVLMAAGLSLNIVTFWFTVFTLVLAAYPLWRLQRQ